MKPACVYAQAVVLLEVQSATGLHPGAISAATLFHIVEINSDDLKVRLSCVEPFSSMSVGYLVAYMSNIRSASSPLAASLGGRFVAVS